MSSQLEFIIQLYMMNLLQQQQQQQNMLQQQQQQQLLLTSPVKAKDLQPQTLHSGIQTQTCTNSQNTMCSSSRSSSPNSNLSPLPNSTTTTTTATNPTSTPKSIFNPLNTQALQLPTPQTQPLTQMLLNNLPPLTQLMFLQQQYQQQQQQQISATNLLLTPTTPNSSQAVADGCALTQTAVNMTDYFAHTNNFSTPSNTNPSSSSAASLSSCASSLLFPSAFTAQRPFLAGSTTSQFNFLQSSTVTSTPCSNISNGRQNHQPTTPIPAASTTTTTTTCSNLVTDDVTAVSPDNSADDTAEAAVVRAESHDILSLDEDAQQVFSSLHSSSGNSSSTTANSKLMCSGVMALETTSDSMEDSTQMPYTPEKSSNSQINPCPTSLNSQKTTQIADDENSNVTPVMNLKNSILTPPSSEQLLPTNNGQTFESSSSNTNIPGTPLTPLTTTISNPTSNTDSFLTEENLKYLRKNSSYLECENPLCRQENLREHFHCYEEPCKGKILSKKDDIIRHLKWHKKRKESLLLGFARFSSSDDCAPEYGVGCSYNWKQTHYHCIYEDCPKVYVSTSDVQMHANFHRKNSEIVQEGFRRFRAHENCKIEECPFYGKKTSHYHCCREGCNHTFKNKADMEKHKTYHMKDHQLTQDGFKKILKTEVCPFEDCKFSTVSNHIHCVREGCDFILHSSTQMISHKRKHDRCELEPNLSQAKTQRDSSEEESPKPIVTRTSAKKLMLASASTSTTSTPLSSLTAEHFLARKRGRPPKKIQLPSENQDSKRIKLEMSKESNISTALAANANTNFSLMNPFMANITNPSNSANSPTDPNAPNLQLTHLMALFQLQNPLFYQNLYPGGMTAANMANILGAAAVNTPNLGQLSNPNVKSEFNDKNDFKE